MIKTSIIVPVYNSAPYLRKCFDSIFEQTQKEIEVIAVNDGSTDESLSILENIQQEHPGMIIYSQANKGPGAARNKGMELAEGEFIYFIDSDDYLVNDAMEICYHCAKTYDADVVMFDADIFGDNHFEQNPYERSGIIKEQGVAISGEEYAWKYWLRTFQPSPCLIYTSADFIRKNHLEFLSGIFYEDNEFYCKMIPLAEKIIYIPKMLYKRRYREGSIVTSVFDERRARDYLQIVQSVSQVHKDSMRKLIRKLQKLWLRDLFQRCRQNNLLEDQGFVKEFYETAQAVCSDNMACAYQYNDLNILFCLSSILEDKNIFVKERLEVQNKWEKFWERCIEEVPLGLTNTCVAIYGTGKMAAEFLDAYEQYIGEIKTTMIFIESNVKSGEKRYRNCDVYHVSDIGNMPIDALVIASPKYEEEMYQTISDNYGDRFRVFRLGADLI